MGPIGPGTGFVRPVDYPHKRPILRKVFVCQDDIMVIIYQYLFIDLQYSMVCCT